MDRKVAALCINVPLKWTIKNNNMPLQKSILGPPTKRWHENTQQIHRTPTPNCEPDKTAEQLHWNHTSAGKPLRKLVAYV